MNVNLKRVSILLFCAAATACTSTGVGTATSYATNSGSSLNRTLIQQQKIKSVNLSQLSQNIKIEQVNSSVPDFNSIRNTRFSTVQRSIDNINVNAVLKNALEHNLVGAAFSDDLVVNSKVSSLGNSYLVPALTPSITMAPNYDFVTVTLSTSTAQTGSSTSQYKAVYTSKQVIGVTTSKSNKLFWNDNPLVLKERIVNGLYDVSKQFADDFNK